MASDPTNEFTQTDEAALDAAAETAIQPVEGQGESSEAKAEAAVAEKMNEIFNRNDAKNQADELEEEGLVGPNNPDGDTPDAEATKDEANKTTADDEVVGGDEAAPAATAEDAERKKTLDSFDPNLKRVAKELGKWEDKDINDFIASNPTLARITFSNIAAGFNNLSLQYAQAARSPQQATQQSQQAVATGPTTSALDDLLAHPEKLKALQEVAGEELTNAFIKPMLAERKQMLEDRAFVANMRREAVVREIDDSFTNVAKSGFEDFYGKSGEVSQDQHNNRFKVAQLADQIRAGAQMQGVNLSINAAVQRAHLIVTANQNQEQARRSVVKQVQKRSTQLTARPTARKTRIATSTRSDAAATAAVEEFWNDRG